jgi:ornithine carbamoyltransferase
MKDFLNIADLSPAQAAWLIDRAISDKAAFRAGKLPATLSHKTLAMIFEKPSLRTRVSFETAMTHLGGHAIYLTQADIGMGKREAIQDVARVLARICDGIMARTFSHQLVADLARHATVPVINALTDYSHPCQAMADLMTAKEHFGSLQGRTMAFIGDGNNVARSLAVACGKLGMNFILSCPPGYELEKTFVQSLRGQQIDGYYTVVNEPAAAVKSADVLYTDTWVSMGREAEKEKRVKAFTGFQINRALMQAALKHAIVMHCLPAYRDFEITDEIFEAHAKTILDEAENRLHFQRTLLDVLMAQGGIK